MTRFVDTNVIVYAMTGHPIFGETSRQILQRIEDGEQAVTSTMVLCEVAWVLEAMGRQAEIKSALEKILSYGQLKVMGFDSDDMLVGANMCTTYGIDFNDGVNLSIMERSGITEVYTNDQKHLGKLDFVATIFQ